MAELLAGEVFRMRVIGTIATTLCYVAAARFDGMLTMSTCRSVDAAAAQLIVREAGGFVSVLGQGGLEAPLSLDARYRLAAARSPGAPRDTGRRAGRSRHAGLAADCAPALRTTRRFERTQLAAPSLVAICAALRTP